MKITSKPFAHTIRTDIESCVVSRPILFNVTNHKAAGQKIPITQEWLLYFLSMAEHYQTLTIAELFEALIFLNKEFVTRLQNREDWDSLTILRNDIRKIIQFIDLKMNKY